MSVGNDLDELFALFTAQLLGEVKAAKESAIPLAAADKGAIIRFLQVNNVVYKPGEDDELQQLREQLMKKRTNGTKTALEALREANDDLEALYGGTMQ